MFVFPLLHLCLYVNLSLFYGVTFPVLAPRHPAWHCRFTCVCPKPATTSIINFFLYTACYPVKACGHRGSLFVSLCAHLKAGNEDAGSPASSRAAGPLLPRRTVARTPVIPFADGLPLLETSLLFYREAMNP